MWYVNILFLFITIFGMPGLFIFIHKKTEKQKVGDFVEKGLLSNNGDSDEFDWQSPGDNSS